MSVDTGTPELPRDFSTLLVVSDLHLGPGQDLHTLRFDPKENFIADLAFGEFLRAHSAPIDDKILLVLNGDIFDFARISDYPKSDEDFTSWRDELHALGQDLPIAELRELHGSEIEYGLRTDDYKSVWKLIHMARGHPGFFRALGRWNAEGKWMVFVKGNHDLALHWELVQKSIRREIRRVTREAVDDGRILFVDDFLQIDNVYIEHGHRFESLTTVQGPPTLPGGSELRLPLGSFVNRYVINDLEGLEPNLDNLKPIDALLWKLVRRHPLKIFTIILRSLPLLRRAFRPYWWKHWFAFAFFFITLLIPILSLLAIGAVLAFPGLAAWVRDLLGAWRGPLGVVGVLLPYIVGVLREIWPKKKPEVGENYFAQGVHNAIAARSFARKHNTIYGVLGHTHEPDVQTLPKLHRSNVVYINSGTWIGTWSEDRPELAGRVVQSFVRFDRQGDEYAHRHLCWETGASRSLDSTILAPRGPHGWRTRRLPHQTRSG
ncbi:MAG TPA: hypothetical protein VMO47_14465 [Rhodothermales bacterium]|nr:hypothetical protein [Rhodothermales bacterium]